MGKVGIRYGQQSAQLKAIRAVDPDQGRWSFSSQQATLRRLDKAMAAFYRRCQAGDKRAGYPRFKALDRWDCVEWPSDGDGCRWQPEAGREIGIDVGVARFATTSDGEVIANPRFARESADELAAAQRVLGRKERGSANRRRARAKVAQVHRRIRNRRSDFHHKTARTLVSECDVIALEDLRVVNMTRSASGTLEQPGTNVAAKSGLNKSILDAGWSQFASILAGKAEEAARRVVFVNPARTSIDCHQCGRRCTRPQQHTVICPVHGAMDADVNGALNIYARAGLGSRPADAA